MVQAWTGKQGKTGQSKAWLPDILALALLGFFLLVFFNIDRFKGDDPLIALPHAWLSVNTIFLSIVLEAIPFILLGVFVSGLIQVYVSDETIQRYLPQNAYAALFPAAVLGAVFPICECAIIPVVRRLILKGMPLHVGVVFLVGAPILNPVVFASTFFAFRTNLTVLYSRMILAFVLAILVGLILYLLFKNSDQVKRQPAQPQHSSAKQSHHAGHEHGHHQHKERPWTKLKHTLYHAADEFFDMGKYLIAGAFVAGVVQTFLDRQLLLAIGSHEWSSTLVMMVFAYLLSLCSEADAFVAASFGSMFTTGSLVAFLVYGPMLDLKNTVMLFAYFKPKFALAFIATVTIAVFLAVMLLQLVIL
ncbi:permease [Caldalkalibacillus thermarum]|uniref:permease n=1 Tax=Caldalkalibacillus thermarum TaxID=296745 RepID=UPI0016660A35|nr:permease [Caldalkalibacillus thermarum]GGK12309.1 permease [Caldalkalibacillus thermarum]